MLIFFVFLMAVVNIPFIVEDPSRWLNAVVCGFNLGLVFSMLVFKFNFNKSKEW